MFFQFGGLEFAVAIFIVFVLAKYIGIKIKGMKIILAGTFFQILAVASAWLANPLIGAKNVLLILWLPYVISIIAWIFILIGVVIVAIQLLMGKEIGLK